MCRQTADNRFSALGAPRRIWTISAIHADAERLVSLHDEIYHQFSAGDRLVYLGNYTGFGTQPVETIDELLTFRRMILARPGVKADDIVYLRGAQEDMWSRLIQLQFCPDPVDSFLWMLGNGMGMTLERYGISPHDGLNAAREGIMPLTRWTNSIRQTLRAYPGHDTFMTQHRRAAFTSLPGEDRFPILFVNAGVNTTRKLDDQGDDLWWSGTDFNKMTDPYRPFEKVIRGFDPTHEGVRINCVTASLDGGCGFGGSLVAANMDAAGEIYEIMEV